MRTGEWRNRVQDLESGLWAINTVPKFGIGQRALLVKGREGNVLWDCLALLDEETLRALQALGGIQAIAISHPHYYTTMIEWSRAFGDVPIYLHEADRQWVMRPDARIRFWSGETKEIAPGMTLVRTGGHFDGFQVLHWKDGAGGKGVLLSGDQPQICGDPRWVSFMDSYPNYVPLSAASVRQIVDALEPFDFDRIYSAFEPGVVAADAKQIVRQSATRYVKAIRA
jgi:glyoxylase-like metal-dependent hydrolase (beta-lactamase superfamily II)